MGKDRIFVERLEGWNVENVREIYFEFRNFDFGFKYLENKSTISNIYSIDMGGKNLKLLFKNTSYLSARY
jgi:hypothetical protein